MSPIAIAGMVCVCVFGAGLSGMALRRFLPEHHLNDASKDVVRVVTGLVATLSALVLSLMIASAKGGFDATNEGFRQSAATIVLLDRTLAQYGPEARDVREQLRGDFAARVEQYFPQGRARGGALTSPQAAATSESFARKLRSLTPATDDQRALRARAIEFTEAVAQSRVLAIEHQDNAIPAPFLMVLVAWLCVMFAGFGLFAPRNLVVLCTLLLGALSLSAAIFLIQEMNDPFDGFVVISRAPMDAALAQLGK